MEEQCCDIPMNECYDIPMEEQPVKIQCCIFLKEVQFCDIYM